jgi:hypothetical protein
MDTIQITQAIRELRQMTVGELREEYIEVFGEANRSRNRDYLIRRIAWRIQANAEGGITERAKLRAQDLANEADIRVCHNRIQLTRQRNRFFASAAARDEFIAQFEQQRLTGFIHFVYFG